MIEGVINIGINKPYKTWLETLEEGALLQFTEAMSQPSVIQGALMPDAHSGYTLPIGAVIKTENTVFPSYVGFDIGCGLAAAKLDITPDELDLETLRDGIIQNIPVGANKHKKAQKYNLSGKHTDVADKAFESSGQYQLGTLGGGNHFIEVGTGNDGKVWIVIHSGSRGFGYKIAEYYMREAAVDNTDEQRYINEFKRNNDWEHHSPEKYKKAQKEFIYRRVRARLSTNIEGHYSFDISSQRGIEYLNDMNVALDYALENRKRMIDEIVKLMGSPKRLDFINRNHNHAEVYGNEVIHRKGATHAELEMKGVIPGNMKDGSFIVVGKGNADSMNSSSHGAGRVLSRSKAKKMLDVSEFNETMKDVVTNHTDDTIDESPLAYKSIFEVMDLQKDLVSVIDHVTPILNVKG